jgi:hypothetical protein
MRGGGKNGDGHVDRIPPKMSQRVKAVRVVKPVALRRRVGRDADGRWGTAFEVSMAASWRSVWVSTSDMGARTTTAMRC